MLLSRGYTFYVWILISTILVRKYVHKICCSPLMLWILYFIECGISLIAAWKPDRKQVSCLHAERLSYAPCLSELKSNGLICPITFHLSFKDFSALDPNESPNLVYASLAWFTRCFCIRAPLICSQWESEKLSWLGEKNRTTSYTIKARTPSKTMKWI